MSDFKIDELLKKLKKVNQKTIVLKYDELGRPLVMLNRMTEPGKAEQHDTACDISIVLDGKGKFLRGGRIKEKILKEADEWRGSDLINNKTISLKKGYIFITEAGKPHRTVPAKDSELSFITIKQYLDKDN